MLPGEAQEPAQGQETDALPGLRLGPGGRPLALASILSVAGGLACSLAFPPAGLWPLAFVGPAPFLLALRGARPRRRLLLGFLFGLAYFGATLYWILLFGELAWSALIVMSACFTALFGLLSAVVTRPSRPIVSALGLAALWTVMEWLRDRVPFGGFGWGSLGVSQVDNRITLRLASITGVWGVSFVVVAVSALLLEALTARGRGRGGRRTLVVAAAAALTLAPAAIAFPVARGRAIDVATVQVDVHAARGLPPAEEDVAVTRMNIELHGRLAGDPPDLAIWGESAVDPGATVPRVFDEIRAVVASVGAPTLMGSIQPGGGGLENQVLALDGEGRVVDRYAKTHLVPFGEYVPWRGALSWVSALQQIPYDLTPGSDVAPIHMAGLPPIGTPVCFENAFPRIERTLVQRGAGFLTVLTNNASYEDTALSRQHVDLSRMRAVEDGRWVVHAAVSGISAFVDPAGEVVAEAGLFRPAILRHTIRSSDSRTWYVRLGDWFPLVCVLLVGGLALVPRRSRGARGAPGLLPDRPRTLVILPTYEERETIEWVLERLVALPEQVDVLVVDDSSPDGTADLVRALSDREPRIRLLTRPAKSGLASAYLLGFETAVAEGYDLVVEMDADLSHQPNELSGLLQAARGHDLTIGSRYVPGGSVTNWSPSRVALSKAGNRYARLMLGVPVADATSGYRVYRRDLLAALMRDRIRSDGYGFQIELVDRSWRQGFDVGESPITFREREHGQSKISRAIVLEAFWLVTIWGIGRRLGLERHAHAQRP